MPASSFRCDCCAGVSEKCQAVSETIIVFEDKHVTALEALQIFRETLFITGENQTRPLLICLNCSSTLKTCFLFAQQVLRAQHLLHQNRSKTVSDHETRINTDGKAHEEREVNNIRPLRRLLPKVARDKAPATSFIPAKLLRTYKCFECPQLFSSFRQLKLHETTHELDGASICKFCCSLFANSEVLDKHNREVHADTKFVCLPCEQKYKHKGHLMKHIANAHHRNQLIYYCCLCPPQPMPTQYDSKLAVQQHFEALHLHMTSQVVEDDVKIDMNEEFLDEFLLQGANDNSFPFSEWDELDLSLPDMLHLNQQSDVSTAATAAYKCPNCSELFATQKSLFTHLAQAHSLQLLICSKCDASFQNWEELWKHKTTHRLQDKIEQSDENLCKICDKTLKSAAALNYHVKTHSNTGCRPHRCPYCGKQFQTYINLKQHLRIVHSQIKRHVCQLCDKKFSTLDHLKKHVLSQHQNERKHICTVCAKRFTQLCHLKQHLDIHTTGKRVRCNQCNATFWRKIDLQRHLTKHLQRPN